jgi:Ni/Co efflux regulator RcnB
MIKAKDWIIVIASFFIIDSTAQEKGSSSKAQKKVEKTKELQARKANKSREEGIKRHRKLQSKEVRKKMKRNERRYQHVDSYDRKPNLYRRIFPRKRPEGL